MKCIEKKLVGNYKNATYCSEQILEVTTHKTIAVQSLTSHYKNHPSKTNKTYRKLLEKQRQTHKERSFIDHYT